jgi:hypothetical protein
VGLARDHVARATPRPGDAKATRTWPRRPRWRL